MTKVQVNSQGKVYIDNNKALIAQEGAIEDVSTAQGMEDRLIYENIGKMYRYTGTTTSDYVNGRYYLVNSGVAPINISNVASYPYNFETTSDILDLDTTLYTDIYRSTNYNVHTSNAVVKVTFSGVTSLTVWINSYAETNYDYTMASTLDASSVPTQYNQNTVQQHTRGFQKNPRNGLNETNWKKVVYTLPDTNEHFIYITYRKDGSANSNDDRGYFVIEKQYTTIIYKEFLSPSGNINITDTNLINIEEYVTAQVTDDYLLPSNIKKDISILGVTGTFEGGGGGDAGYKVDFTLDNTAGGDALLVDINGEYSFDVVQLHNEFFSIKIPGVVTFKAYGGRWGSGYNSGSINGVGITSGTVYTLDRDSSIYLNCAVCLLKGTLITMADGTFKPIEEIKICDLIMNYDGNPDVVVSCDGELNKTHTEYDIWTFEGGYQVKTVHRHRFYNCENQRMMYMDEWELGQHAYTQDGKKVALINHKNVKETVNHYTLFTKNQNYFAQGLLSGNRFTGEIRIN